MNTQSEQSTTEQFAFQCPHCEGDIAFSVEALVETDDDFGWDDEDESDDFVSSAYHQSMEKMTSLIHLRQYTEAVPAISANVEDFVEQFRNWDEDLLSMYVPAFEQGARVLALMGETERLNRMHEVVTTIPKFRGYVREVEKHQREVVMFQSIREAVRDNPDCLQPDVKVIIGEVDGRHVAALIGVLENAGEIVKVRDGRQIRLSLR